MFLSTSSKFVHGEDLFCLHGVIVADVLTTTVSCDTFPPLVCVKDFHLYVEQPCLQVDHSFLSQSQVPDHHIQGFVCEEALVHRGHAGWTTNVPDTECHRILLCEERKSLNKDD